MNKIPKTYSLQFDKSNLKHLIIHQMANDMLLNWEQEDVMNLFKSSSSSFVAISETKKTKIAELREIQKNHITNR